MVALKIFSTICYNLLNELELFLYKVADYASMKVAPKPTLRNNDDAVSPVFGAILMILLTFVLAGATVAAVYNDDAVERISNSLTKTPTAVIEIEGIENIIPNPPYHNIDTILQHKSGDSLALESTMIILSGEGSSYVNIVGQVGQTGHVGGVEYGNIIVKYVDLTTTGKRSQYNTHNNPSFEDNLWSTGEQLILNGDDSINGSAASTVTVSVNGISNTSNNYGFDTGTTVTIKIFDKTTQRIIAEGTSIAKPAE